MAKKKFSAEKLARLEGTTRFVRGINSILCILLAVSFGALIAANAVPQMREYEKLQAKLKITQGHEEEVLEMKEYKQIQLHALREDPSYLEVEARDRLNYYRPGERVLRFDPNQ